MAVGIRNPYNLVVPLQQDLNAFKTQVPTIDELMVQTHLYGATFSATATVPLLIAPFPMKIVAAGATSWGSGIAQSDTDYWSVTLYAVINNSPHIVATKTTKLTDGQALSQRADWNFDGITFDPTYQQLAKGDMIQMTFTKVGVPANWTTPHVYIRYQPV